MKTPLILIAMLPLAGCISFGAKPPPTLLTLTSVSSVPVGQNQDSATAKSITIQTPVVPQSLATARVPVQATPTSIAYVTDAQWAEPPARLFARLVSDTVSSRTGLVVLSTAQSIGDPGGLLGGELRSFGLDATTREAVVKRRFEARVPVSAIDATSAAAGINQAANQVATEVADWIGR